MVISLYYCPPTYCRQSTWVHVYQLFTRILNIVILCGGTCRTVVFNSLFSLQKKSQVASGDVPMETYYYGCQSLLGTRHHTLTFLQWPWPLTYDYEFRSTARYMPAAHTQTKIKVRGQRVQKRVATNGRTRPISLSSSPTRYIGIPSPTHSFTLGLNPSSSANPPYPSISFFSFRFHCMDFPDCLLYFWAYPSFYFLLFLFLHCFSCRFRAVD